MRVTFHDGIVLLTGASSGIGEAMARLLAPQVRTLILVARRRDRLENLKSSLLDSHPSLTVDVRVTDLSDLTATREMASSVLVEHGAVDILINNAGLGQIGVFHETSESHIDALLGVNIIGLTALTRSVLPSMVERGRGAILNVSSGFGLVWMPFFSVYAASKQFVTAFTDCLRTELKGTGVTVCQVCPGPIATEFEVRAGSPLGPDASVPMQMSSYAAARSILRAFEKNRALHIPGFWPSVFINLGRFIPRWGYRFFYSLIARGVRKFFDRKQVSSP